MKSLINKSYHLQHHPLPLHHPSVQQSNDASAAASYSRISDCTSYNPNCLTLPSLPRLGQVYPLNSEYSYWHLLTPPFQCRISSLILWVFPSFSLQLLYINTGDRIVRIVQDYIDIRKYFHATMNTMILENIYN